MATRVNPSQAGIQAMLRSQMIRDAMQDLGEKVQTRAVQLTVAEAVDTGLMAASWRVVTIPGPRGWFVRVYNTAQSPEKAPYPIFQEFGWRTRNGRHIPGKRILARSIDAIRI